MKKFTLNQIKAAQKLILDQYDPNESPDDLHTNDHNNFMNQSNMLLNVLENFEDIEIAESQVNESIGSNNGYDPNSIAHGVSIAKAKFINFLIGGNDQVNESLNKSTNEETYSIEQLKTVRDSLLIENFGDQAFNGYDPGSVAHNMAVATAKFINSIRDKGVVTISGDHRHSIFCEIVRELDMSIELHGDLPNNLFTQLAILTEEVGEFSNALLEFYQGNLIMLDNAREELIQCAAMCLNIILHYDQNRSKDLTQNNKK